jgi:oxygen-independent coproporphyrinogen III oxidase
MSELAPTDANATAEGGARLGLYVHVPFCATTCDFCAFYQVKPDAAGIAAYLDGIEEEMAAVNWSRPVTTVFLGGGTPGLLSPDGLRRLGGALGRAPGVSAGVEWSIELAPASVTPARLEALREVGVTRVSLGVQSLRPSLLDALGRHHTREQVLRAYERIRASGFPSVNLDLMFALPGQDEGEWVEDLREAVALGPDHLSTYCLTFEEDTALWLKLSQGRVRRDVEQEARLYERTWEVLEEAGYAQYEVSNFARPGHRCRHNLDTWAMQEWVGLGPSAASQWDGWRGRNVSDLQRWREALGLGERAAEERVALTPALLLEDALIFGLRMNAGVDLDALGCRFGGPAGFPWGAVRDLLERMHCEGLAESTGTRWRLTGRGRLLADAVGSEILSTCHSASPA